MKTIRKLRPPLVAVLALAMPACGAGIDAGEQGGRAFIALTVFLVIGVVILYLALGREE
jgi:hypothetical protein